MTWKFEKEFICPKDYKSLQRYKEYKDYYKTKYSIAKNNNPTKILEIGVRAGYSAISFLSACPEAQYVGIDAENNQHGGQDGPWTWWAKEILKDFNAEIIIKNTQKLNISDLTYLGLFDMIHIDGDHSTKGALHDMKMCWPLLSDKGILLIDDYDYIDAVRNAVDKFYDENLMERTYIKSLRGDIIFKRKQI